MLADPPATWQPPRLTCFLAGTARSGSTYLSELMANTGVLGNPAEYFNETVAEADLTRRRPANFPADLIEPVQRRSELVRTLGATANGVASTKIFAAHLKWIAGSIRIAAWFPNIRWIQLYREDKIGQAISATITRQTKVFTGLPTPSTPIPIYSAERIDWVLRFTLASEAFWSGYFLSNRLTPLILSYEDLERDPAEAIRRIATHLGETLPSAPSTQTALVKQRTALNEEWRERFLRESGDLNRVDHKFGQRVVPRTWRSFRLLLQGRLTAGPFNDPID